VTSAGTQFVVLFIFFLYNEFSLVAFLWSNVYIILCVVFMYKFINHRANYSATERPPTPEGMKTPAPPHKGYFSPVFPLAYKRVLQVLLTG
jgi:hypothetical protein